MTLITVSTVKGAPGGTTCALLLARTLAAEGGVALGRAPTIGPGRGDTVLLVECDPAGGDLAPRLGLRALPGLASLALASRHGLTRSLLLEHSQRADALGHARLLAGVAGPEQGMALSWIFADLAEELSGTDLVAVVDTGRIRSPDEPVAPFLDRAAVALLVVSDSVPSLLHARAAAEVARAGHIDLCLVVAGARQHSLAEIGRATGTAVIGTLGFDRAALSDLGQSGTLGRRRRLRAAPSNALLRDAERLVAAVSAAAAPAVSSGQGS